LPFAFTSFVILKAPPWVKGARAEQKKERLEKSAFLRCEHAEKDNENLHQNNFLFFYYAISILMDQPIMSVSGLWLVWQHVQ
jgi:hypothetical protein